MKSNKNKFNYTNIAFSILIFSQSFYSTNIKSRRIIRYLDIMQNDDYFSSIMNIIIVYFLPNRIFLVLAVKSDQKIND